MSVCKDLLTLSLDKPTVTPQFGITMLCHKLITKGTPLSLPFGKKIVSNNALSSPTLLSTRRSWVGPRNGHVFLSHELCALRVNRSLSRTILPWLTPLRVSSKSDMSSISCYSISLDVHSPAQVPPTYLPICSHHLLSLPSPYPAPNLVSATTSKLFHISP